MTVHMEKRRLYLLSFRNPCVNGKSLTRSSSLLCVIYYSNKRAKISLKVKNKDPASGYNDQCGSPSIKSLFWSIAQYCFCLIATVSDKNLEPLWQTKTLKNFGKFRSLSFSSSLLQCFCSHETLQSLLNIAEGKGSACVFQGFLARTVALFGWKTRNEHFLKLFFKGRKSLNWLRLVSSFRFSDPV